MLIDQVINYKNDVIRSRKSEHAGTDIHTDLEISVPCISFPFNSL